MRERVAHTKAKSKVKLKAESTASFCGRSEHGEDGAPDHGGVAKLHGSSAKKQRTFKQLFYSNASGRVGGEHGRDEHHELGASHDNAADRLDSCALEHFDGIEVVAHSATTSTELFVHDREEDRVLLDWLRERSEHARCSALLQQIMEWTGRKVLRAMRSLAKAQGITIRRLESTTGQNIREAARRHFKAAVAQEKKDASHVSNSVLLVVLQSTRIPSHAIQSTFLTRQMWWTCEPFYYLESRTKSTCLTISKRQSNVLEEVTERTN